MTLEEAKASVDNMVSDSDYPRSINSDELEAIPEPVEVFPSAVISHFIDSMDDEEVFDAEVVSPAIAIDDLDIPIWEDEPELQHNGATDFRRTSGSLKGQLIHSKKPSHAKWLAATSESARLTIKFTGLPQQAFHLTK